MAAFDCCRRKAGASWPPTSTARAADEEVFGARSKRLEEEEGVTVEVRLFGEFREYLPEGSSGGQAKIELPEGATAYTLVEKLGLPYAAEEGVLAVAVNDEVTDLKAPLADGDVVSMFPPLAGG
jgi:molybdopterin converting factor small subunit